MAEIFPFEDIFSAYVVFLSECAAIFIEKVPRFKRGHILLLSRPRLEQAYLVHFITWRCGQRMDCGFADVTADGDRTPASCMR